MDLRELLDRYEASADERDFVEARRAFERTPPEAVDPHLLLDYGWLLETHARNDLRSAVEQYERALEFDPGIDKAHYQLIGARAGLRETQRPIELYRNRLSASPDDVREYRFLATAYLAAHDYDEAARVVADGLELEPNDPVLIEHRGDVQAATGDPAGALADWQRALELDPENLSGLYSTAFLLEREGRIGEAKDAWRSIIDWCERRGNTIDIVWPGKELARLASLPGS